MLKHIAQEIARRMLEAFALGGEPAATVVFEEAMDWHDTYGDNRDLWSGYVMDAYRHIQA